MSPSARWVDGVRDGEAALLVGGALVGRRGLVADERRARIEGERLEVGVNDGSDAPSAFGLLSS